jgi:hypothetical protein
MTEAEWLAGTDPRPMLDWYGPRATQRKLRLFAAACCRDVWPLLADRWSREAVETTERFADRVADRHDFQVARDTAADVVRWVGQKPGDPAARELAALAAKAAHAVTLEHPLDAARAASEHAAAVAVRGGTRPDERAARALHAGLLRDLLGPLPFRPLPFDPSWFHWENGGVKRLARDLYEHRRFADGLPALGDALARAGCTDAEVLAHCRGPGPHVRGCWVVDLLLGKT